jgi:hypothetical protein
MPKNRFDRRARLFSQATGIALRAAREHVAALSAQEPLIGPAGRDQMLLEGLLAPCLLKGIYAPELTPPLRIPVPSVRSQPAGPSVVSLSPEGRDYWQSAMQCNPANYSVPGLRARDSGGMVELFLVGTTAGVRFDRVRYGGVCERHKQWHASQPRRKEERPGAQAWCIFDDRIPADVTEAERVEADPGRDVAALAASTLLRKIGLLRDPRLLGVDCWRVMHGQWNVVEIWMQHLRDRDVERLVQRLTSPEFAPQWTLLTDPSRHASDPFLRFSVALHGERQQIEFRFVSVVDEQIPVAGRLRSWPSPGTSPFARRVQEQSDLLEGSR